MVNKKSPKQLQEEIKGLCETCWGLYQSFVDPFDEFEETGDKQTGEKAMEAMRKTREAQKNVQRWIYKNTKGVITKKPIFETPFEKTGVKRPYVDSADLFSYFLNCCQGCPASYNLRQNRNRISESCFSKYQPNV